MLSLAVAMQCKQAIIVLESSIVPKLKKLFQTLKFFVGQHSILKRANIMLMFIWQVFSDRTCIRELRIPFINSLERALGPSLTQFGKFHLVIGKIKFLLTVEVH